MAGTMTQTVVLSFGGGCIERGSACATTTSVI